jgi:hypothetical protein
MGFMLFNNVKIEIPFGGEESSYCVFPGNKKLGYCRLNETILESNPNLFIDLDNASARFAMPPLKGHAGEIIIAFVFFNAEN